MSKIDYKIDYRAQTAAHYTSYTMSPQFQNFVGRNQHHAISVAEHAMSTVKEQAVEKTRASLFPQKIDVVT